MNHFTDRDGFNAIGSQQSWLFRAAQPRSPHNPVGAYFTTYEPTEPNLSKKIFVPVVKLAFVFKFAPPAQPELRPIPGGRGRLRTILYSPVDYPVERAFQLDAIPTGLG
jgi:hypothetical protein